MTKADHIAAVVAEKDAEIARLNELLRSEGANRYWEGRWRDLSKVADALEAERDKLRQDPRRGSIACTRCGGNGIEPEGT